MFFNLESQLELLSRDRLERRARKEGVAVAAGISDDDLIDAILEKRTLDTPEWRKKITSHHTVNMGLNIAMAILVVGGLIWSDIRWVVAALVFVLAIYDGIQDWLVGRHILGITITADLAKALQLIGLSVGLNIALLVLVVVATPAALWLALPVLAFALWVENKIRVLVP